MTAVGVSPQCPVQSLEDAVKGLFVCCLFLEYVSLSQRFVPELINFLLGLLYIATPNTQSQGEHDGTEYRVCGSAVQVDLCAHVRALTGAHPYCLLICGTLYPAAPALSTG